jgi:hypothetical protein
MKLPTVLNSPSSITKTSLRDNIFRRKNYQYEQPNAPNLKHTQYHVTIYIFTAASIFIWSDVSLSESEMLRFNEVGNAPSIFNLLILLRDSQQDTQRIVNAKDFLLGRPYFVLNFVETPTGSPVRGLYTRQEYLENGKGVRWKKAHKGTLKIRTILDEEILPQSLFNKNSANTELKLIDHNDISPFSREIPPCNLKSSTFVFLLQNLNISFYLKKRTHMQMA